MGRPGAPLAGLRGCLRRDRRDLVRGRSPNGQACRTRDRTRGPGPRTCWPWSTGSAHRRPASSGPGRLGNVRSPGSSRSSRTPGGPRPTSHTPAGTVIAHRDERGDLLDVHTAAVEIINLVRPLVAVSWLVSGLAMTCQTGRTWRTRSAPSPCRRPTWPKRYVGHTRSSRSSRHAPPRTWSTAVRRSRSGSLIVLDAWGTNHDPRIWQAPDTFDPRRFRTTPVTPYNLVPQGGGDRHTGHRCPGEDMTLAVLTTLVPRLAALPYSVIGEAPGLRRMPPKPRSTTPRGVMPAAEVRERR